MGSDTTIRRGPRGVSRRQVLQSAVLGVASATGVGQVYGRVTQSVTEIEDWIDLAAIGDDLSGEYELVTDLNLSSAGYDELVTGPEEGWSPIGDVSPFTGTFDGNGFVIRRLENDGRFAGLFAGIGGATIQNLRLLEIDVTGQERAGGLVSFCVGSGEITNVIVEGSVTGDGADGTGGVVGATLTGDGSEPTDLQITEAAALVDVTGSTKVGGILGEATGDTIETSYARGAVSGDSGVGGIIGESAAGTTLTESYTGTVVRSADIETAGGLVGTDEDITASGAYWDGDEAGATILPGVGTELRAQDMKGEAARESMPEFDFEETWAVQTDPEDYPVLQWEFRTPTIDVAEIDVPTGVSPGDTFEVRVVVTNDGDGEGSGTVTANFEGETQTQETSDLFPLREETLTFSTTAPDESGTFEFTVSTDAGTATATVEVVGDPAFEITETTVPETAEPGVAVEVSVTVTNTGDGPGEVTVAHELEDGDSAQESVELDSGDSETISFSATIPDEDGSYDHTFSVDGDTATATTTVEASGESSDSETETPAQEEESSDGSGPGFGVLSTVAGLGGVGYVLRRRLTRRDGE